MRVLDAQANPTCQTALRQGAGGRQDEFLLHEAAQHGPSALVWQPPQCMVAPRSYAREPFFAKACAHAQQQGWPVYVRQSGGSLVPQGQGILNLSMAYPWAGLPLSHSDAAYGLICQVLQQALAPYGIDASAQPVQGSFCDGRFNLAVQHQGVAKKIVGTAQLWRRIGASPQSDGPRKQIVLIHAVILAQVDCQALTDVLNAFEEALQSTVRYRADRIISLHQLLGAGAFGLGGNTGEGY